MGDRTEHERERQREKAARKSAAERNLESRPVVDPQRRAACEANDALWLRTYLPGVFRNPFTPDQLAIIRDVGQSLQYGTLKCIAAPRGDGKSSITRYLILKYSLARQIVFGLIVCATGGKADEALKAIKSQLRRRSGPLWEDYPLECDVAAYVGPAPARANNATVDGRRIHVEWQQNRLILPSFADADRVAPIIVALGWESEQLQGANVYDQRPDFVMLDDLDNRGSLAAEDGSIAGKIEEVVDKTIAGLGGPGKKLGQVMLCTITSPRSAAARYSSPTIKPAWSGIRIPRIKSWPERMDLWEQYVELRQAGKQVRVDPNDPSSPARDPFGREAHAFYLANHEAMDAGAVLSNKHDFVADELPDGTPTHLSALQKCFDFVADHKLAAFQTEHQNDPPEDVGPVESGISPRLVQKQVSGFERGVVPPECAVLVHGVDVGKWWLHWVVRAFKLDGTGYTIDYGRQAVHGTKYKSEEGLDRAIRREVLQRIAEFRDMPYAQQFRESLSLVDAGYRSEAVYAACREAGLGVMPIMGIGYSAGCAEVGKFADVMRRTRERTPVCDGVYYKTIRQPEVPPFRLVCASADQWKLFEHDRWMTARDKPGCMSLFGEPHERPELLSADEREHGHFAHHICAEVEVEEEHKGALRRRWLTKSKDNHWLDASYYADVAAAIKGVRVFGSPAASKTVTKSPEEWLREAQGRPTAADYKRLSAG